MSSKCALLELPSEIRLQIYEYIYNTAQYNRGGEPQLILRDDHKILCPRVRWSEAGSGLLKTCRKIHAEAAPIMYDHAYFRIRIYVGDGWPQYPPVGPVDATNPMIRQMQHIEITLHLTNESDLDPAFRRLGLFATALEKGKADVKTLRVIYKAVTSYKMTVTRELVANRVEGILSGMDGREASDQGSSARGSMFRRMLTEGQIVSID